MAFRKKVQNIVKYKPDILIVLECENENKIDFSKQPVKPYQTLWVGDNPNKGVFVASFNKDCRISVNANYCEEFKHVVPIDVDFKGSHFLLFAVWTKNTKKSFTSYVVQAHRAFVFYSQLFDERTLIIGDFNSNKIWDNQSKKEATHSDMVVNLDKLKIKSLYHLSRKIEHGLEQEKTFFMHRNKDKGYHIDYAFAGEFWQTQLASFKVGEYDDWVKFSDHVPIILNFNEKNNYD